MALTALSGVGVLAVFPAEALLSQGRHRDDLAAELARLSARNRDLGQRARLLDTDGEIERLARLEYDMVRPGEEAYALMPAPYAPEPAGPPVPPAPAAPRAGPWWDRLWDRITSIF
jgi:hypothetical protein